MSGPTSASACRLTSEGRGAIAVVRVWGEAAIAVADRAFRVRRGKSLANSAVGRLRYGRIGAGPGDEAVAVVLSRDPPEVEIQGHGGTAVTSMTLAALAEAGAAVVPFGVHPSLEVAAEIALGQCSTVRGAEILLDQAGGALRRDLEAIGHAISAGDPGAVALLDGLMRRGEVGVRLVRGWGVVLTGRPNVGKSRLLNRLAGFDRAIVSDEAGTTRDVVTCRTAFDGWPVELCDTAGLHDSADPLERAGMGLARDRLASADLVVVVLDRSQPLTDEDAALLESWPQALVAANKRDLPASWPTARPGWLGVSAASGEGMAELADAIAARLVVEPPQVGQGVPFRDEDLSRLGRIRSALDGGDRSGARTLLGEMLVLRHGSVFGSS